MLFVEMDRIIAVNHFYINLIDVVFGKSFHRPVHQLHAITFSAVFLQYNQIVQFSDVVSYINFAEAYFFPVLQPLL